MGGTEGSADQETEVEFGIYKMVSCHTPMGTLKADMEKL